MHNTNLLYQFPNYAIKKIKKKLCESNLTVAKAFAECGVDYNGGFVKLFKHKTGMTPSEYRAMMIENRIHKTIKAFEP